MSDTQDKEELIAAYVLHKPNQIHPLALLSYLHGEHLSASRELGIKPLDYVDWLRVFQSTINNELKGQT